MIKRFDEMKCSDVAAVRDGNGSVNFRYMLSEQESYDKLSIAALVTLEKGCSIGRHPHGPDAEIYIITEGVATVDDNGTAAKLYPGDIIYTGNNEFHAISNEEDKPVKFYALVIK